MRRFIELYLDTLRFGIFVGLLGISTAQFGQECQCNVPTQNRVPCNRFRRMGSAECITAGCCYDTVNPFITIQGFSTTVRCFMKDTRYCQQVAAIDRCQVSGVRRESCGFGFNRFSCHFQGCCYNENVFPSCFRPLNVDIVPVVNPVPAITVGQWGFWSTCSQSCGTGIRTRTRECLNADKQSCIQGLSQQIICGQGRCQAWGQWREGACSAVCGRGVKSRTRVCLTAELIADASCYSTTVECTGICPTIPTIVRPTARPTFVTAERGRSFVWGPWEPWSDCTNECSPGRTTRAKVCYVNRRLSDPSRCANFYDQARPTETRACNMEMCRQWSQWSSFPCPQTCGIEAFNYETRYCIDVPAEVRNSPAFLKCSRRQASCNLPPCRGPVVSQPFTVSVSESRPTFRTTPLILPTKPSATARATTAAPTNRPNIFTLGTPDVAETKPITFTLPTASKTTGRITRPVTRKKTTTPPPPSTTIPEATKPTITQPVPSWSEWTEWTDCSQTCLPGLRKRTRKCVFNEGTVAKPFHCKADNGEMDVQEEACNEDLCPEWGEWITYECSVSCVLPDRFAGVQVLSRDCKVEDSAPALEECFLEIRNCSSFVICPEATAETPDTTSTDPPTTVAVVDPGPVWAEWGQWSECSSTCAPGIRTRARTCLPGVKLPRECDDGQLETFECNTEYCQAWSMWTLSDCDATCGEGFRANERVCLSGNITSVSEVCYEAKQPCSNAPCQETVTTPVTTETTPKTTMPSTAVAPVVTEPREPGSIWQEWGPWSECTRTCSHGVQTRERQCLPGVPPQNCVEGSRDSRECNSNFCRFWSSWRVEPCSKTCGEGGVETSERRCFNGNVDAVPAECYERVIPCRNSPPCEVVSGTVFPPEEQDPKLDILFLVDSSDYVDDCEDIKKKMKLQDPIRGSILNGNNAPTYTRMKKFIKDFESGWRGISSQGTRIGIQLFSNLCSPKTRTNLYVEKQFNDTHDDFAKKYVNDLPYLCGDYWLYWALQCSLSPVLTEEFGDRPGVPSVVVALLSNAPTTSQPSDVLLQVALKRLKEKQATVIVAAATRFETLSPNSRNRYEENMRDLACEGAGRQNCPGYLGSIWDMSRSHVAERIRQALRGLKNAGA